MKAIASAAVALLLGVAALTLAHPGRSAPPSPAASSLVVPPAVAGLAVR